MKKSLMALSAAMLILSVSSCKNDAKTGQESNKPATETTVEVDDEDEISEPVAIEVPAKDSSLSLPEANAKVGAEYLNLIKENDPGVKFTDSGLGYRVLKKGKGARPNPNSVVRVKYTGKHIDGSVFDASGDQTIDFPLNGVIAGFSEGIQKMKRGSVYELYIPGDLAYGPRGAGGAIGPNETLIFEVELVDFR